MFQIDQITGDTAQRVRNFNLTQDSGTTRVILCSSVNFLNELMEILQHRTPLKSGSIQLDCVNLKNKSLIKKCRFITNEDAIYSDFSVAENVFTDYNLQRAGSKRNAEKFLALQEATGYHIDPVKRMKAMPAEQRKIVEILRCVYLKPKLLIVRELYGLLSASSFSRFSDVLKMLNESGTTVLYLTNQWEEAVRLNCDVTMVVDGKNQGTYSAQEVLMDPSVIYYLNMGAKDFLQNDKQLSFLQDLKQGIQKASNSYSITKTVEMFSQYLVKELQAQSIVTYMINKQQNKIFDIVPTENKTKSIPGDTVRLKLDTLLMILAQEGMCCYYDEENPSFFDAFLEKPNFPALICYALNVNTDISFVMQINFQNRYSYTKRNILMIEWIAQEMALFIENTQLMGNSLLLKESHHRIKNNLQVIVSLLEMEKAAFPNTFQGKDAVKATNNAFNGAIARIKCIAGIHDLLAQKNTNSSFLNISQIVKAVSGFYQDHAQIHLDFDEILVPYAKAVSVALIVNEIISNSIKHNDLRHKKIRIGITARRDNDSNFVRIICRDNGNGFPERDGVVSLSKSEGVGTMVIESVVVFEFDGEVRRINDGGAVVQIDIPMQSLLPIERR